MVISKLMKQRSTTPVSSKSLATKGILIASAILMATAAPVSMFVKPVTARDFAAEIQAVQNQINQYQAEAGRLASEAKTLENELARLSSEKATLQAQIDAKQIEYDKLVADIAENERKIAMLQDSLGDILAKLHVGEEISPLEMLAGSSNISEYLDQQAQREAVRDGLKETIDEINTIKKQLEQQKVDVQRVLEDQKAQREMLAAKEAEQQRLVTETRGQEAAYQQLSAKSEATKKALQQQQAAELAARARSVGGGYASLPGDGSRGGYPVKWANAPMNSYVDNWGMYSRQCVSYAAFKVQQSYGNMPYWGGRGNANQWDNNAYAAGIPTGRTPKPGAVGVVNSGQYGHVAWVESVNANGTINISHYNVGWTGEYAEWYNLSPSYFDVYIYFGER